jgi:hypothetical protein
LKGKRVFSPYSSPASVYFLAAAESYVHSCNKMAFINDRISNLILQVSWCDILVNMYGPWESKRD